MKINFFIDGDVANSSISNFILSIKKINFILRQTKEILTYKSENILYVFPIETKINLFKKISLMLLKNNFHNFLFLLPNHFKLKVKNIQYNILYYPIKISVFENQVLSIFSNTVNFFDNIVLFNDNVLFHKNNNKKIYLTEIESKIVQLLFNNKFISKNIINKQVLNQKPTVDSKSLESHLYRLRKKLFELDTSIQITTHDEKSIKIIKTN